MLRDIISELRILFAELLIHQALRVMPGNEPEAKLLKEATDSYFCQSAQHARWAKFPA